MAQNNKVVSLKGQQGDRLAMPAALVRLRDASGQSLKKLLSEFFDSADDALFNMADKAGSNQEQTAYFDAMRELRLRRKSMVLSVLQRVSRAFNEMGRFDPLPGSSSLDDIDQDSLTLMDHGELEQKVAIDNLITKLRNRHTDAIRLLVARVSHVTPGVRLEDRQMPLSPEVICTGLGEASGDLDIDIRAKLVVLKLFDKLLISRLESLYLDANRLLVAEGVLPDLKRPPVGGKPAGSSGTRSSRGAVPPSKAQGRNPAPATSDEFDGASEATFSELSALLRQDGLSTGFQPASSSGRQLDTGSLMTRLGHLQTHDSSMGGSDSADGHNVVPLNVLLRRALAAEEGETYSVQQVDSDVINLVTMLFDFILEDRQLPPVMKALIGRLQIPVLKVALCDRSFFNRGGHPARKLLNELAMAGIGWNEKPAGQRDPLRESIESVVNRLLNEFTDNVDLFSELLKDFGHFMDLDRRRRELVEQRLRDAEEGRARQEQAKKSVDSMLEEALEGHDIPAPVESLLGEPWRKYLQWVMLREGEDSQLWSQASELTRKLIWSVDPKPVNAETRGELLRAIPGVVDTLRSGLQSIAWDPFAIDTVIRDLELAHVDVMQHLVTYREPQTLASESAPMPEPVSAPQPTGLTATPEISRASVEVADSSAVVPVPKQPTNADIDGPHPSVEPPANAPDESEGGDDQQWLERADNMRVGSWIELMTGGQKVRCKLAAFIKATGKYIFVNRNGAKVAEYQRSDLASALAAGHLTMLDDGLIFDRALESIIDNLRHSRKD